MFDVSAALQLTQRPVALVTETPGVYDVGGNWVPGVATNTPFNASLQPTSGRDLKDMPEGVREEAVYTIWAVQALVFDDRVLYNGETYRVIFVFPWQFEGTYTKAVLGRLPT